MCHQSFLTATTSIRAQQSESTTRLLNDPAMRIEFGTFYFFTKKLKVCCENKLSIF
jgi:hypothetical protein